MMVISRETHLTIRLYYEKLFFFFWENRLVFLCSVVILKISQKTFFFVVVWLADKSLIFLVIPNNSMNKRKNSKSVSFLGYFMRLKLETLQNLKFTQKIKLV